jgi:tetratricopeptide (TPR) repeat protein
LQEAVRLKPTLAEAQGNLGIALAEAGRMEEAVGHYREALRLRPDYGIMHYNLGNALLRQRQWEEARSHFAEAVRLRPDFAPAQEMLNRLQTLPTRNP